MGPDANEKARLGRRVVATIVVVYATWLAMLATHELGHVIAAWIGGGKVLSVSVPLLGFSQTIVWPNPHERLEVWGGPVLGGALPLVACAIVRAAARRVPAALTFFAGFCLIANGGYLGVGWRWHSGDAGDLLRLGTPVWTLIAFGAVAAAAGLAVWHRCRWMTWRADPAAPASP
jgi:hypothetical protein